MPGGKGERGWWRHSLTPCGGWPASSAFPGGRERRPPFTGAPRKLRAVGRQQRRLGGQVRLGAALVAQGEGLRAMTHGFIKKHSNIWDHTDSLNQMAFLKKKKS